MNQRSAAANILLRVLKNHEQADFAVEQSLQDIQNPRVRRFIKELVYGTLRWYHRLDAILQQLLQSSIKAKNIDLYCLLLLGLYQLIYMHTPQYAAVSETVEACVNFRKPWAKSFINKLLRQFIKQEEKIYSKVNQNPVAYFSHPLWMIEKIKTDYPEQWQSILNANNIRAPLTLRVNRQQIIRKDFLFALHTAGIEAEAYEISDDAVRIINPLPVQDIPGFKDGWFSVQDAAAQLAVSLLDLKPQHRVLDACTAPGGKLTHILETVPDIARIVAIDVSPPRMRLVQENIARLKLPHQNLYFSLADAAKTEQWWNGKAFDRILLDAPCSALGVMRRHPDIKVLRTSAQLQEIMHQQRRLLQKLWPLLKSGGKLLYATCSILHSENDTQIQQFLQQNRDAKLEKIKMESLPEGSSLQILPGNLDMDGFYYARLVKK